MKAKEGIKIRMQIKIKKRVDNQQFMISKM